MKFEGVELVETFEEWEKLFSQLPYTISTSKTPPQENELYLKQVHSATIVPPEQTKTEADGFFTTFKTEDKLNKTLVIQTADCLPVTLVNATASKVAVSHLHAGWRGYAKGIVENSFSLFKENKFPLNNTSVYISPAIFGESYECGEDVEEALKTHWKNLFHKFPDFSLKEKVTQQIEGNKNKEKIFPDLQLLCALEALAYGIPPQNIKIFRKNTYTSPDLASYRRACHQNLNEKQRMFTRIVWKN